MALRVESAPLHVPNLEELATVLQAGLRKNFAETEVKVSECPDLTKTPFNCAAPGLGGHPVLVDVGGVDNLHYEVNRAKARFDFNDIAKAIGRPGAIFAGPGAGFNGVIEEHVNCELMATTDLSTKTIRSQYAVVDEKNNRAPLLKPYSSNVFGVLGNFIASDGKPGKVIEIKVSKRTGEDNFVSCLRKILSTDPLFADKALALGGVFLVTKGKIRAHIMPDFPPGDFKSRAQVDSWLVFYEMSAPLTCLSVFATKDLGLDLRMEHTHFYSDHNEGGHYHRDTTPDEVEYHAFFTPCETVFRVERHSVPPGAKPLPP